jgi:hypothetical protein
MRSFVNGVGMPCMAQKTKPKKNKGPRKVERSLLVFGRAIGHFF